LSSAIASVASVTSAQAPDIAKQVATDHDARVKQAEDLAAKLMQQLTDTIKAAKNAQAAQVTQATAATGAQVAATTGATASAPAAQTPAPAAS